MNIIEKYEAEQAAADRAYALARARELRSLGILLDTAAALEASARKCRRFDGCVLKDGHGRACTTDLNFKTNTER